VQAAELPACIGTARALARMYAALIGEVDGARLLAPETLASATKEQASGVDQVLLIPSRFSAGYMLPTETCSRLPTARRSRTNSAPPEQPCWRFRCATRRPRRTGPPQNCAMIRR
jgi:hypothetical protein